MNMSRKLQICLAVAQALPLVGVVVAVFFIFVACTEGWIDWS